MRTSAVDWSNFILYEEEISVHLNDLAFHYKGWGFLSVFALIHWPFEDV